MRIKIREHIYESVKEAAAAHNTTPGAIYKRLRTGTLDYTGIRFQQAGPVTVAGITFPSKSALARFVGDDTSHTRNRLNRGKLARKRLEEKVLKVIAEKQNGASENNP